MWNRSSGTRTPWSSQPSSVRHTPPRHIQTHAETRNGHIYSPLHTLHSGWCLHTKATLRHFGLTPLRSTAMDFSNALQKPALIHLDLCSLLLMMIFSICIEPFFFLNNLRSCPFFFFELQFYLTSSVLLSEWSIKHFLICCDQSLCANKCYEWFSLKYKMECVLYLVRFHCHLYTEDSCNHVSSLQRGVVSSTIELTLYPCQILMLFFFFCLFFCSLIGWMLFMNPQGISHARYVDLTLKIKDVYQDKFTLEEECKWTVLLNKIE